MREAAAAEDEHVRAAHVGEVVVGMVVAALAHCIIPPPEELGRVADVLEAPIDEAPRKLIIVVPFRRQALDVGRGVHEGHVLKFFREPRQGRLKVVLLEEVLRMDVDLFLLLMALLLGARLVMKRALAAGRVAEPEMPDDVRWRRTVDGPRGLVPSDRGEQRAQVAAPPLRLDVVARDRFRPEARIFLIDAIFEGVGETVRRHGARIARPACEGA
mmetsp:Transcript_20260/g.66928  ORF Transcript_20260/g.66928 Transcript_20260/m.66928 type:complete len:215 (+) Transcript_20260:308-952(+)